MDKFTSLADFLGNSDVSASEPEKASEMHAENLSPQAFCKKILESIEFKTYLLNGITLGDLPSAIIIRLMDVAWGKPVDRLEVADKSEKIEELTREQVSEKLMRVQRMLLLVQAAQDDEVACLDQDDNDSSIH